MNTAVDEHSELLRRLGRVHEDPELCDVLFVVEDEPGADRHEVHAVSALLAMGSPVFRRMLFGSMRESRERVVEIKEVSAGVFRQLVLFLHTGKALLDVESVVGVWHACERFQVQALKEACSAFIGANCLSWETALHLMETADVFNDPALCNRARRVAARQGALVLTLPELDYLPEPLLCSLIAGDDFAADEEAILTAVMRWGRVQVACHLDNTGQLQRLVDVLAGPLSHVRLPLVPARTLTTVVQRSGAVPAQRIVEALAYQADPKSVVGGTDRRQFTPRARTTPAPTSASPSSQPPPQLSAAVERRVRGAGPWTPLFPGQVDVMVGTPMHARDADGHSATDRLLARPVPGAEAYGAPPPAASLIDTSVGIFRKLMEPVPTPPPLPPHARARRAPPTADTTEQIRRTAAQIRKLRDRRPSPANVAKFHAAQAAKAASQ